MNKEKRIEIINKIQEWLMLGDERALDSLKKIISEADKHLLMKKIKKSRVSK